MLAADDDDDDAGTDCLTIANTCAASNADADAALDADADCAPAVVVVISTAGGCNADEDGIDCDVARGPSCGGDPNLSTEEHNGSSIIPDDELEDAIDDLDDLDGEDNDGEDIDGDNKDDDGRFDPNDGGLPTNSCELNLPAIVVVAPAEEAAATVVLVLVVDMVVVVVVSTICCADDDCCCLWCDDAFGCLFVHGDCP